MPHISFMFALFHKNIGVALAKSIIKSPHSIWMSKLWGYGVANGCVGVRQPVGVGYTIEAIPKRLFPSRTDHDLNAIHS
eukprot:3581131-Amphidinium_carterae.1